MAVLGIDGCKDGWVGVRVDEDGPPQVFFAPGIAELVDRAGPAVVVGVDMPIGLPTSGVRAADALARKAVGPRHRRCS